MRQGNYTTDLFRHLLLHIDLSGYLGVYSMQDVVLDLILFIVMALLRFFSPGECSVLVVEVSLRIASFDNDARECQLSCLINM